MNEISADTMELTEAVVPAAEFIDELSDEAIDRATMSGALSGLTPVTSAVFCAGR